VTSPISTLSKTGRRNLLQDLNYLNTAEIKSFCKEHRIPYAITVEDVDGTCHITPECDRKGVMLHRVRHFLQTAQVLQATCFRNTVVSFSPARKNLTAGDKLFYGQYQRTNRAMIALVKKLTNGKFKDGAVARILARDFWTAGRAPTFREYAAAWLKASRKHKRPNPEWAFLSDRHDKKGAANWKTFRRQKAKSVMKILDQLFEQKISRTKN
jgi:hypothetical protein